MIFFWVILVLFLLVCFYWRISEGFKSNDGREMRECNPLSMSSFSSSGPNCNRLLSRASNIAGDNGYRFTPTSYTGALDRKSFSAWGADHSWILRSGMPDSRMVLEDLPGGFVQIGGVDSSDSTPNNSKLRVTPNNQSRFRDVVNLENDLSILSDTNTVTLNKSNQNVLSKKSVNMNRVSIGGGVLNNNVMSVTGDSTFREGTLYCNSSMSVPSMTIHRSLTMDNNKASWTSHSDSVKVRLTEADRLSIGGGSVHQLRSDGFLYSKTLGTGMDKEALSTILSRVDVYWKVVASNYAGVTNSSSTVPYLRGLPDSSIVTNRDDVWDNDVGMARIPQNGLYQINVFGVFPLTSAPSDFLLMKSRYDYIAQSFTDVGSLLRCHFEKITTDTGSVSQCMMSQSFYFSEGDCLWLTGNWTPCLHLEFSGFLYR